MEKEIGLYEALAGTRFEFRHLDGRPVAVSSPPGKIIGHGETMCVDELGMPLFGRAFKYGNLFIIFSVVFPQSLTKAQIKTVRECLHTKESEMRCDPAVKQEFKLKQYDGTEKDLLARLRRRCIRLSHNQDSNGGRGGGRGGRRRRPAADRVQ